MASDSAKAKYSTLMSLMYMYMYVYDLLQVDDELEIKAYYAGHVLGAALFHIKVGSQSVVYTVSKRLHLILQLYVSTYWSQQTR